MAKRRQTFVDQVRAAVDGCGTSRAALCRRVGMDRAVMSRFMSGKGFLSEASLNRLAAALGLRVEADEDGREPRRDIERRRRTPRR